MKYDVTGKNLAKKIKKDGTLSKVNDIAKTYEEGSIIVTFFGVFIAVLAYQIIHTSKSGKQYKQWIVQLKSEDGTIYEMKHTQAHSNKNMPKTAKIIQPSQPKIKIPEMKYQLCLPSARTDLDFIIQNNILHYVNELLNKIKSSRRRKSTLFKNDYSTEATDLEKCIYLRTSIMFIRSRYTNFKDNLLYEMLNILKQLMRVYHPDITHKDTSNEFMELHSLYTELSFLK